MGDMINRYLKNPNRDVGGATVPFFGEPGSGKSNALCRMGELHLNAGHIVAWRGTKQCQWALFLSNDIPVTIWKHDTIQNWETYIQGSRKQNKNKQNLDLQDIDNVEVKEWSNPKDDLVEKFRSKRVNVIYIPGLDNTQDHQKYFFMKKWVDVFDALIKRSYGDFITMLGDEFGDIFPSQQELRKPFSQAMRDLPPKLAQLRKNNVWLFVASHNSHDMHYFLWKIKSNSVGYMRRGIVKNSISPNINQAGVNSLDTGAVMMPGPDKATFQLKKEVHELSWMPDNKDQKLRVDFSYDIPNLLKKDEEDNEKKEGEEVDDSLSDKDIYTLSEIAEYATVTLRTLRRRERKGELNTVKVNGVKHTSKAELRKHDLLESE